MTQLDRFRLAFVAVILSGFTSRPANAEEWLTYPGGDGPGKGKKIVFIAAEESYRSELSMPLMARILARHGFTCTVLFGIDPATGTSVSQTPRPRTAVTHVPIALRTSSFMCDRRAPLYP